MIEPTPPFEGDALVVCVDMWDSLSAKRPLQQQESHSSGVRRILQHNLAVLDVFRSLIETTQVPAWIVKALGDGVMAVIPVGDDPEASVGMALRFAGGAVSRCAEAHGNIPAFHTAAAVSCGRVTMRVRGPASWSYASMIDVHGYPVDVASRLVAIAARNQVLMCDDVRRQVEDRWLEEDAPASPSMAIRPDDGRVVRLPGSAAPGRWPSVRAYQLVRQDEDGEETFAGEPGVSPIQNRAAYASQLATVSRLAGAELRSWVLLHTFANKSERIDDPSQVIARQQQDSDVAAAVEDRIERFGNFARRVVEAEELAGTVLQEDLDEVKSSVDRVWQALVRFTSARRGVGSNGESLVSVIAPLVADVYRQMSAFTESCHRLHTDLYLADAVRLPHVEARP